MAHLRHHNCWVWVRQLEHRRRPIDLCFIDATHSLDLNQKARQRITPYLVPGALVVVHDTRTWHREHFNPTSAEYAAQKPDGWLDADIFQPHPEEREFINWICAQHSGWTAVHLHTTATLRHGLTLLQRVEALPIAVPSWLITKENGVLAGSEPQKDLSHSGPPEHAGSYLPKAPISGWVLKFDTLAIRIFEVRYHSRPRDRSVK